MIKELPNKKSFKFYTLEECNFFKKKNSQNFGNSRKLLLLRYLPLVGRECANDILHKFDWQTLLIHLQEWFLAILSLVENVFKVLYLLSGTLHCKKFRVLICPFKTSYFRIHFVLPSPYVVNVIYVFTLSTTYCVCS